MNVVKTKILLLSGFALCFMRFTLGLYDQSLIYLASNLLGSWFILCGFYLENEKEFSKQTIREVTIYFGFSLFHFIYTALLTHEAFVERIPGLIGFFVTLLYGLSYVYLVVYPIFGLIHLFSEYGYYLKKEFLSLLAAVGLVGLNTLLFIFRYMGFLSGVPTVLFQILTIGILITSFVPLILFGITLLDIDLTRVSFDEILKREEK